MDEYITESAEIQEVADPETDVTESAETQEVADPAEAESKPEETESSRTKQDAAFAEQRRRIQELEELERQYKRDNEAMMAALSRYFDGETAEELSIAANAYAEQRDPDEYRQEWEHNREFEELKQQKERLEEQLLNAEVERLMREGLREVQEIDPNVKSLDELGEPFADFIRAGLPTKEAYYATKAMELKEKVFAPDAIGKVADTKTERDYYTEAELDALTKAELDELARDPEGWAKVMRSMERLPKR